VIAGGRVDFFVSYTTRDEEWATWVAWQLEDAGYTVLLQAWDFAIGAHFVSEMHRAAQRAVRTVAVLSSAYLRSAYAAAEWQEAWRRDPGGEQRRLLVFRVENCDRPGLLGQLVTRDLFGLDRDTAREVVLSAAAGARPKPRLEPTFPGLASGGHVVSPNTEPEFPASPDRIVLGGAGESVAQYICYVARDRLDSLYHQIDLQTLASPRSDHPLGRLSLGHPEAATEDPRSLRATVSRLLAVRQYLDRNALIGDLVAILAARGQLMHEWYVASASFQASGWDPALSGVYLEGSVGSYVLRLSCAKEYFSGLGREGGTFIPTSTNRFLFEDRVALPMQGLVRVAVEDRERGLLLGSPLYLILNPLRVDLGDYNDVVL
jgi:TIR domain